MIERRLVRKQDSLDLRDYLYLPMRRGLLAEVTPPQSVDLQAFLPPPFDQGSEGSCGPNAADGMMCFLNKTSEGYSRQQIYYGVRVIENDVSQDDGVETRDLFKVLTTTGAAPESMWPYTPQNLFTAPPADVLAAAKKNVISTYARLSTQADFITCLSEGFPFILGFNVFESFMSDAFAKSGVMPIPASNEQNIGGHDVLAVGYDLEFCSSPTFKASGLTANSAYNTSLLIRNSWGSDWGIAGHFWMPMSYATSPSTGGDAWTARL